MRRSLLLSISLFAMVGAPAPSLAQTPTAAAVRTAWPQLASDLPADPAVRYGALPNGMRYAILKNATPPGESSIRLRIDTGSINERDNQRGIAHFIEHMVLNGTKNVPEGEFIRRLERAGLKFGPDTNASTGFDETVFKLDLPKSDEATVNEAMFLLREVADEATFDTKGIDDERGIILSEERSRATPVYRAAMDELGFLFKGQPLPNRSPIGTTEVIRTASRERFVEYYEGYFRPERATLVVVGDIDVAKMEAKIRSQFASWRGQGRALAKVPEGTPISRGREAHTFIEPGVTSKVSLNWVNPAETRPDTEALRRETLLEQLGLQVLNRRLQTIATASNPPFIGAGAGQGELADTGRQTAIGAVFAGDKYADALAAITREQRRLAQFGVTQAELDREISELRAGYASAAAGAATRNSRALAEGLVATLGDNEVFTTPASQLARFEQAAKGLKAAEVSAAVRAIFTGQGPLVYLTAPTRIVGSEAALLASYDAAAKMPVTAPVAVAAKAWPYETFGTPGAVVERRELGDGIGATAVRFANGTRLTVKKTSFQDDQIVVAARFGAGRTGFRNDGKATPEWAAPSAVTDGGVGKLTEEEIKQTLASNVAGAAFSVDVDRFALTGVTRPQDFALEMKLLAAYYTDPAWRPTGWDRYRAFADTIHDSLETTPGGVFGRDSDYLLAGKDSRWMTPTRAQMKAMPVTEARAALAPVFGRAPVELVIVGDVDVEEAIRQTAATFGALPAGRPDSVARPAPIRFPAPAAKPVRLIHRGRADQGLAFIAWPTAGFHADMKQARTLSLLAEVVQLRLTDEIREKQGTTYSPQAGHSASSVFDDYGYLSATIEAPPEKLAGFLRDAEAIARQLRDRPVTADELDRARRPLLADVTRQRGSSNVWWLGALDKVQTDPRVARGIASQVADLQAVTPADLQRAARRFLVDAKDWKLVVVPEAKPTTPQASSGAPARK